MYTPVMVDIRVLWIQLDGKTEVCEAQIRVLRGILALLNKETGPLDQGVHLHFGLRCGAADEVGEVGHGLCHLFLEDVECGAQEPDDKKYLTSS